MAPHIHPEGVVKPVAIAIALTIAVCGLCMAAYIRFVVDPKIREMSNRLQAADSEAAPPDTTASTPRRPRRGRRNAARVAALIQGLANTRDELQASSESSPEAHIDVRPSDEELRADRLKKMATLEKEFEAEPVDADWAKDIEDEVMDAVALLDGDLELDDVTCHTTLCRARMTHRDPGTRHADLDRLGFVPALRTQTSTFVPPDDENTTVMYFAREGHKLSILRPRLSLPPGLIDETKLPPSVRGE
jgi:hypothetical protein